MPITFSVKTLLNFAQTESEEQSDSQI